MIAVDREQRKRNQVKCGTGKGRPSKLRDYEIDQLISYYNTGKPMTELAKRFGISRTTVYRLVKERSSE